MYTHHHLWLQALFSRPIPVLIAACGRLLVARATFHPKKWRCKRSAIFGKTEGGRRSENTKQHQQQNNAEWDAEKPGNHGHGVLLVGG
jgi:hypothetical protein